ncbi:MAG: GIY-YIG nuclease family protein [Planctomycetota bacterium]|jgi:hypothetical protein
MLYVFVALLGVIAGGVSVYAVLAVRLRSLGEQKRHLDAEARQIQEALPAIKEREQELSQQASHMKVQQEEIEARVVSYKNLLDENAILKHDLQNIDVNLWKVQLDRDQQREKQETLDQRTSDLGGRFLKDNIKWIGSSLTANNFTNCRQRLQKVIEWCRGIDFDVSPEEEATLLANLEEEYKKAVRAALEREEQARIKAQIREEQKLEREIERELKQLERERAAIQAALDKALAETKDEHSAEVERLKARLTEAEEKSQRAMSRAQMTKSGHVYVISNIGSFGEGVFKIGLTRRLEPMDRVKELGDASVPFPFDVHMMISSDDAPALENALHRVLHNLRINKTNPRKEFFRTEIEAVRAIVETHHGEVDYVADAEALQYRQSLEMSDEDLEFVESVYDQMADDGNTLADD